MKYEIWVHFDGADVGDAPTDDKVAEKDSRAEAEKWIDQLYENGRYHAETYTIKEVSP